jgi:ABC-type sugar transport system ATPase subunit
VFDVSDRVTVLRDGRKVGTYLTGDLDEDGRALLVGQRKDVRPDSILDRGVTALSALAMSVPSFIIAIFLVSFLAGRASP